MWLSVECVRHFFATSRGLLTDHDVFTHLPTTVLTPLSSSRLSSLSYSLSMRRPNTLVPSARCTSYSRKSLALPLSQATRVDLT